MGRKPRSIGQLRRRPSYRHLRDRILIVCEGVKTEPQYFEYLRKELCLGSLVVVAGKECGSTPTDVLNHCLKRIYSDKENQFNQAWCIIDVEAPTPHSSLDQVYQKIRDFKPKKGYHTELILALSNPCFEYWYILHFKKTSRSFQSSDEVKKELKKYYPSYSESDKKIFSIIYPKTSTAIQNVNAVIAECHYDVKDLRQCNPSTLVHKVVEYLQQQTAK